LSVESFAWAAGFDPSPFFFLRRRGRVGLEGTAAVRHGAGMSEPISRGRCPSCGVSIEFDAERAGERAECPACGAAFALAAEARTASALEAGAGARQAGVAVAGFTPRRTAPAAEAGREMGIAGAAETLKQARAGSPYQALRGVIGAAEFAGYVVALGFALGGVVALAVSRDIGMGLIGLTVGGALAVVLGVVVRASAQASLVVVDIADVNLRILARLDETAREREIGRHPAGDRPGIGGGPAEATPGSEG
jgi:hypothetical protein